MSLQHNGFTFTCDANNLRHAGGHSCSLFKTDALTERTAIEHARAKGWFVGTVRVTKGAAQHLVRSMRRVLCPCCSWWVGVN